MLERRSWVLSLVLAITACAAGCADKTNTRISMLEDANTNLTEQLNYSRGELTACQNDREDLVGRLVDATGIPRVLLPLHVRGTDPCGRQIALGRRCRELEPLRTDTRC